MDAERYARLRALFDAVAELSVAERNAYLSAHDTDAILAREVLELIEQSERRNMEQLQRPLHSALTAVSIEVKPGDRFGVWRVERALAEGGMGAVYLVARHDGHYQQTAALKFIKGCARAEAIAYFARERQLLASLAHPQIARLLDGGANADGRPYLVMEYVDGVAIDQYCRAQKLDVDAVLELFVSACAAVAFAHRQLVVHCDLKPSNLLVTKDGRPILLDFGIAQLTHRVGADDTLTVDAETAQAIAYTPRYASPEQRRGEGVTTASDVYSLGIVLRELLAIALPDGDPGQELQSLIAKATHAHATQRYVSVDAMCADIFCYQQQRPLSAMPAAPSYRLRKLLRRRWPVLLAAATFAVTVVVFTGKVMIESQRAMLESARAKRAEQLAVNERDVANTERDRASRAEASAQRVNAFLGSVLSSVDPDNARNMDRSLMQSVLSQAAAKAETELHDRPRELREIATVIADSYYSISDFAQAVRHYELAQANLNREETRSANGIETIQLLQKHANALIELGQLDAAGAMLERGLAQASEQLGAEHELTLYFRTLQAKQLFHAGRREQGLALAEDNYLRMQQAKVRDPSIWFEQLNLTAILNSDSGRFERAEVLLKEAIALATENYGAASARTLRTRNSLAVLLLQSQRHAEAVQLLRPLARDVDTYLGKNHLLAISLLSNLGIALRFTGEHKQSGAYYVEAHARAVASFGAAHSLSLELANNLAIYELSNGQAQQALRRIDAVLSMAQPTHARLHPFMVEALRTRARALSANRQVTGARATWREVIARDLELYGAKDEQTRTDQAALAKLPTR
jgi:eukaryotic-like serine/threonine-protein kinase